MKTSAIMISSPERLFRFFLSTVLSNAGKAQESVRRSSDSTMPREYRLCYLPQHSYEYMLIKNKHLA
jgi:hypothetical protein